MFKWTSPDQRRLVVVPGDKKATIEFCADHFVKLCKESILQHDHFFVALSGGSTPKSIYEKLCTSPRKELIDWKKVSLFWSDERSVPPEHPDSNYSMAMHAGFNGVPIPKSHIHRMHAEEDIVRNARLYEEVIEKNLGSHPFDLIMLGLGEDGHTASLFPETEALKAVNKRVVANYIAQKETWRMTFTFELINSAQLSVVYAIGESKQKIAYEALMTDIPYPVQKVGTKERKTLWIMDAEASALLPR